MEKTGNKIYLVKSYNTTKSGRTTQEVISIVFDSLEAAEELLETLAISHKISKRYDHVMLQKSERQSDGRLNEGWVVAVDKRGTAHWDVIREENLWTK